MDFFKKRNLLFSLGATPRSSKIKKKNIKNKKCKKRWTCSKNATCFSLLVHHLVQAAICPPPEHSPSNHVAWKWKYYGDKFETNLTVRWVKTWDPFCQIKKSPMIAVIVRISSSSSSMLYTIVLSPWNFWTSTIMMRTHKRGT